MARALESGWTGLGPLTERFEQEFARHLGVKHAVMTNSCTAALHLALVLRGIGPGHRVAVPAMTFCSTAHVVKQVGAEPVLCDVHEGNLTLDYGSVFHNFKDGNTWDKKWIMPVLYAGQVPESYGPTDKDIYDCAHAVGSTFDAKGKLCCWSFHAVKNLACGEGGMLTTDDEELAARARKLRWMGISRDTFQRSRGGYSWEYDVEEFGFKSHGNDLAAAVGLEQLRKLPSMQEKRHLIWERYRRELGTMEWLPGHSSLLAVLRHKRRDALMNHLHSLGIQTGCHYKPLHLMSCYRGHDCPTADWVWKELVTLPLHPTLSDGEQTRIIEAVKEFR